MKPEWGGALAIATTLACIVGSSPSFGATFGNDSGSVWADTPMGRFECRDNDRTNYLQMITVGGKSVFQEQPSPDGPGGSSLYQGVRAEPGECPGIIANEQGYLIIARAIQPPQYRVFGYAVINFNDQKLLITELGQGQGPGDSKISDAKRLVWGNSGLTLQFFGYLADDETPGTDAAHPKFYKVRFNFSTGAVEVVK